MYEPERLTSFDSMLGPESFAAPVDAGDLNKLTGGGSSIGKRQSLSDMSTSAIIDLHPNSAVYVLQVATAP